MATSTDTCPSIASAYGITLAQFYAWNPAVGLSCGNLWSNEYYCVATSSSSGSGSSITTPMPHPANMESGCTIETAYDISASDFDTWNPDVGTNCAFGVWLNYYYCVSNSTTASGGSTATSTSTPLVTFSSTSHHITILPQPTYTTIQSSQTIPIITVESGPPSSSQTSGCLSGSIASGCGSLDYGLFGCAGGCGLFGCDGGCGLIFCGGGCNIIACGPGCGDGACVIEGGGGGSVDDTGLVPDTSGNGENDDCTSLATASACTEYVSSYSTSGTASWSTTTTTQCGVTELHIHELCRGGISAPCLDLWQLSSQESVWDATHWSAISTTSTTAATPSCNIEEDPDQGIANFCSCSGYAFTLRILSGTVPCAYTALPTVTTSASTTPTSAYTFTDPYSDVIVCETSSLSVIAGISVTLCEGTRTTIVSGDPPVTTTSTSATPTSTGTGGEWETREYIGNACCADDSSLHYRAYIGYDTNCHNFDGSIEVTEDNIVNYRLLDFCNMEYEYGYECANGYIDNQSVMPAGTDNICTAWTGEDYTGDSYTLSAAGCQVTNLKSYQCYTD
ncbi:hypothetical protein BP5796_01190 [Coleophoma crateriformis]|uniref:LysM domain-containing protein n=1 Tax=Coleophoma crateriformis TaxID=565419 RepID=A0A3D8SZR8_9HELO|nr:hypothetical protein BP5796_01190 [Coleophoma crateriformis]